MARSPTHSGSLLLKYYSATANGASVTSHGLHVGTVGGTEDEAASYAVTFTYRIS